jgi:hypothetical protein
MAYNSAMRITQKRLHQLFDYDADRGVLLYKTARGRMRVGDVAGWTEHKGYIRVIADGITYSVHRLIWFYVKGRWPINQLDHRDLTKSNNRIGNLREATNSQNKCNQYVRKDSQTRIRGVTEDKRTGRFRAYISIDQERRWLGFFATKIEAQSARVAALHLHGEFARE